MFRPQWAKWGKETLSINLNFMEDEVKVDESTVTATEVVVETGEVTGTEGAVTSDEVTASE